MKILYISDLEDTLLISGKRLSLFTVEMINRYIAGGGLFTIASPCMDFSCGEVVSSLHLNVPGIIMNGVCLYSFDTGQYHDVKVIEHSLIPEINEIFSTGGCRLLMYVYDKDTVSIFHQELPTEEDKHYLSPQAYKACREICHVPVLMDAVVHNRVICAAAVGLPDQITPVYEHIRKLADLETAFYPWKGFYCLEVFDHTAGMANAALRLKRKTHATELTVFGGSLNSVPMMEVADYCFAPRGSKNEARKIANGLLDNRDEDGVARFISLRHNL